MSSKQRIYLFDTTLRDGAQTVGVDFSLEDKLRIAGLLQELGIDYIEGGYPGANPTDTQFMGEKRDLGKARLIGFGMIKRAGRSVDNDPGFKALIDSKVDGLCLVAKAWDYHVRVALNISNEENIEAIADSVRAVVASGKEAMIDAEHFFDGYKANPAFALACAKAAIDAGARWVVLCDTNGGTLPEEVERIVGEVARHIPGERLGIHCHNDTESAVANSLAAVRGGARQIQGTLNGLGERCGNANLTSIIPTLMLKSAYAERFETTVAPERLRTLTHVSRVLDDILNRAPNKYAPYVGANAFASKAGIHVSAIMKDPQTYEHVPPEAVGNERRLLVSKQAGVSNIMAELERVGIKASKDDPAVRALLDEVKERESIGYSYEAAQASFELLARRRLQSVPTFFRVDNFRVMVERRHNAFGELVTISDAIVRVSIDGETLTNYGEGAGPIHALDQALRRDLGRYQAFIEDVELVDYKVRILTGGTEAVTRVLVESMDRDKRRWATIGVSPNIVDASFEAILDSINYKLLRDGATVA
jgi:2-isopropylmalate synthase